MEQTLTTPCNECPFLKKYTKGYKLSRLKELALQDMPCHKTCVVDEDGEEPTMEFRATDKSVYCAGAMIFLAKRKDQYNYGFDDTKLNMEAAVR